MQQRAFSLVELSIVLVILGLLVGGILAGQSLIRASELRSVSTEYTRYLTAIHAFRDKYFALPGDFNKAQDIWGTAAAAPNCDSTTTNDARTCNGNGNGVLEYPDDAVGADTHEHFRFWQHLANAGLIEGTFTGITGSTGTLGHAIGGTNVPSSKLSPGLWLPRDLGTRLDHGEIFNGPYGNSLIFGGPNGVNQPNSTVLKPEEAWNVDTKSDDGNPATGKVTVLNRLNCTVYANGTAMTNGPGGAASMDARYALTTGTAVCGLLFRNIGR